MVYEKLADKRNVENSATVRERLQAVREQQLQHFAGTKLTWNAEMDPSEVHEFCSVEPSAEKLLKAAMQQLHLSARAFHRVLKLARMIAASHFLSCPTTKQKRREDDRKRML